MLDLRRIRAVTLDLDDTLWPVWPTIRRANERLCAWLLPRAPGAAALAGNVQASLLARQAVLRAQPRIAHDLGAVRREVVRELLRQTGEDTALAEPAYQRFHEERQRVTLFHDSLPALEWLAERYPLVALSNGSADIESIGLGRYFRAAVSAADVGIAKPDVRIFEAAASAIGLSTRDVLHVGDDPRLDGIGALEAGMQMVWINRTHAAWPVDCLVRPHATVHELVALRQWLT